MNKDTNDGRFRGNTLVIGRTGRDKTTFVQNLAINRMFGDLKKVDWTSKIELSKKERSRFHFVLKIHL